MYDELWKLCAGPLVDVPQAQERVYYFPQGHMEQVSFSFLKIIGEHFILVFETFLFLVANFFSARSVNATSRLKYDEATFCSSSEDSLQCYER